MSFKYESIQDEACTKFTENNPCFSEYVLITPELTPNYPLKDHHPQACCLPLRYKDWADKIKSFEVFDDDIWLVTYPKSGTTWSQEMIYLLKNNLDYKKASSCTLHERFPFLELEGMLELLPSSLLTFQRSLDQPRPRLIKTHLPIQFLPDQIWTINPKIIYVYRQPKDVAVSYYHHHNTLHGYQGGIKIFVDAFVKDFILYSPYHEHISSFLQLSEKRKNVLLLRYEDMKNDLPFQIMRNIKFLGLDYTEKQILELAEHLSFNNMKKNPSVNNEEAVKVILASQHRSNENNKDMHFIRKGEVGGWKNDLTPEMAQKINDWSSEKAKNNKYLKKYL